MVFEGLKINSTEKFENYFKPGHMLLFDFARFYDGFNVEGFVYKPSQEKVK